jgi:hypothetical protein
MGLINKIQSGSKMFSDPDKISDFNPEIIEYGDRKKDVTNTSPNVPKISLFSKYKYYIIGGVLLLTYIYYKFKKISK